ncbi:MAG: hypothetical protein ACJA06_000640 [Halocynthiibacter sp.]|jgi:hypothetical protein
MTLPRPTPPSLSLAFTIRAQIAAPIGSGPSLGGTRLHIAITGGEITGPRLQGRVLPGGSDWPLLRADGATQIEALYSIEASDGTPIIVRNNGLRTSTPEIAAKMRTGELLDPSQYYFRSTPTFDAPDGPHQWLRETVFVASLAPAGREIIIDVFAVE